jgi:hypothetical protein
VATIALHLRRSALFRRLTGNDGLTRRERRQRAKRYFATAGRRSSPSEVEALAARMKARGEAESRHTEV